MAKPISSISGFTAPFIGNRVLKSSIEMRAETDLSLSAGTYGDAAPSGHTWSSLCGG